MYEMDGENISDVKW